MTSDDLSPRIAALDVVRGFALCGILVANVRPISDLSGTVIRAGGPSGGVDAALGLLVEQRFYPIFALLFGAGFALLLRSAAARTDHPRLILLRRLLVLLGVGLVHMFVLWHGDVLTIYAAVGLVVLLPATWLPRRAVAILAGVFGLAALVVSGGGYTLTPALFLLGAALVRYGVVDRLDRITWRPAVVLAVLALPALAVQSTMTAETGYPFALSLGVAGLLVAGAYACALCRLLRTRLGAPLSAVFTPLGRMALTNYLTATVIVVTLARLHGHPEEWSWPAVLTIAASVLTVQWAWSALWLRRYRQGPLEWLWRWATWARRPPLKRLQFRRGVSY